MAIATHEHAHNRNLFSICFLVSRYNLIVYAFVARHVCVTEPGKQQLQPLATTEQTTNATFDLAPLSASRKRVGHINMPGITLQDPLPRVFSSSLSFPLPPSLPQGSPPPVLTIRIHTHSHSCYRHDSPTLNSPTFVDTTFPFNTFPLLPTPCIIFN